MALKSGRVGVRTDQVDAYGRLKLTGDITAEDITADNLIAKDEIELYNSTADFGTNAKAKIKSAIVTSSATEGQVPTADGSGGYTWEDIEIDETNIASESTDSGKVLTANGSGGTVWQYPSASNINSGSATNGQVLTANGSGGATWGDASGGELYLHEIDFPVPTSSSSTTISARFSITTNDANAYTKETLLAKLGTTILPVLAVHEDSSLTNVFLGRITLLASSNEVKYSGVRYDISSSGVSNYGIVSEASVSSIFTDRVHQL